MCEAAAGLKLPCPEMNADLSSDEGNSDEAESTCAAVSMTSAGPLVQDHDNTYVELSEWLQPFIQQASMEFHRTVTQQQDDSHVRPSFTALKH
jgi:hypothetical protein